LQSLSRCHDKFDLTVPYEVTVPLMKDVQSLAPQTVGELMPGNASTNLLVNREPPPFDNLDLRRALAVALDQIGPTNIGSGVDDPDQQFFENYGCGSERNYTGCCSAEFKSVGCAALPLRPAARPVDLVVRSGVGSC
jgi:hypothetical protein